MLSRGCHISEKFKTLPYGVQLILIVEGCSKLKPSGKRNIYLHVLLESLYHLNVHNFIEYQASPKNILFQK